jgi:hypothetical protein
MMNGEWWKRKRKRKMVNGGRGRMEGGRGQALFLWGMLY